MQKGRRAGRSATLYFGELARVLAQIRAAQGSYALSPLFIDTHHIKMKPGWAGLLFTHTW